jgi:hypothetical protein
MIILKEIYYKNNLIGFRFDSSGPGHGPVERTLEYGNAPSRFIKRGEWPLVVGGI